MKDKTAVFADIAMGESKDGFDPLTNSADCAAMCAKLEIHTQWWNHSVACISNSGNDKRDVKHDGTDAGKEAAWRYAACKVAEAIGRAMK